MRTLAKQLGYGVMSLYNHVADKDDLLDGMLELVAAEIVLPPAQAEWQSDLRDCAISAYKALLNHRWAGRYWSRSPGPTKNLYHEAILRVLRQGQFSEALACQGYHALTMHVVGFAVQVAELPFTSNKQSVAMTKQAQQQMPVDAYPYLNEHIKFHLAGKDKTNNFKYMLDLILDGLERDLKTSGA